MLKLVHNGAVSALGGVLICSVLFAFSRRADDVRVVIPKNAGTDKDLSDIGIVLEIKEWTKHRVWGEVGDDIPRDVIIGIDRYCYGGKLGDQAILKRYLLYDRQASRITHFEVVPTAVRRQAGKDGYQVEFALTPAPIVTATKTISLNRGFIEQWHYAPDGTLAFERIVKAIGPNDAVILEK